MTEPHPSTGGPTIALSGLEELGLAYLLEKVQADNAAVLEEVKAHITMEANRIMSNNEEILDRHDAAISTELQQVVDAVNGQTAALQKVQEAVDAAAVSEQEKQALQTALDDAKAQNEAILARVQAGTTQLESDDAPPA